MTRDDAILYLAGRVPELLADTGVTMDSAGLGDVVDDALLHVGVSYSDLATADVADADVIGFRKVLRWQALERAADAASPRVNESTSLGTPSVSKSVSKAQINDTLAKRLEIAKAEAAPYLAATAGDSWQAPGALALNTYEGCWTWPS